MQKRFLNLRPVAAVLVAAAVAAFTGCLDEPEIDERWTLLEVLESTPVPDARIGTGSPIPVRVQGRITYRDIHTGFAVAELRYSPTLTPADLALDPETHDEAQAQQIDLILANSVTAGRATRAVTGFDHLIQEVDLSFDGWIPPEMTASGTPTGGMFLVFYLGEGDEIRLGGGRDSLVVTPFASDQYEILSTGLELSVDTGGTTP
jgi:hypothetical protein